MVEGGWEGGWLEVHRLKGERGRCGSGDGSGSLRGSEDSVGRLVESGEADSSRTGGCGSRGA